MPTKATLPDNYSNQEIRGMDTNQSTPVMLIYKWVSLWRLVPWINLLQINVLNMPPVSVKGRHQAINT